MMSIYMWQGRLSLYPSNDTIVSLEVTNDFPHENVYRSVCALRGTVDVDKYVVVGTHHDESGSGNADPASGQAVLREMLRLIAQSPGLVCFSLAHIQT